MPEIHKDSLRLFYALWPDDATRTSLAVLQNSFSGRKSPYGNLHVTLTFLGQQSPSLLPVLTKILNHLPATKLTLTLDRLGYFNGSKIAWAGMHAIPDGLISLQQELVKRLVQCEIPFHHEKSFTPHITLVRNAGTPVDLIFSPIVWKASELVLVASTTQPSGSAYKIIASRHLDKEKWVRNEGGFDPALMES